jgi:hypothetical protein
MAAGIMTEHRPSGGVPGFPRGRKRVATDGGPASLLTTPAPAVHVHEREPAAFSEGWGG